MLSTSSGGSISKATTVGELKVILEGLEDDLELYTHWEAWGFKPVQVDLVEVWADTAVGYQWERLNDSMRQKPREVESRLVVKIT